MYRILALGIRDVEGFTSKSRCCLAAPRSILYYWPYLVLFQSACHLTNRQLPVFTPHHQLCYHWVIEYRNLIALSDSAFDSNLSLRLAVKLESSAAGEKVILGAFRVYSCLDCVTLSSDFLLPKRKPLPARNSQLPLHEVDASDHLRDRVLHLKTGIHLHEVELLASEVEYELDCAGICVAHRLGSCFGLVPDVLTDDFVERRGGLFDDLLVAALDRAVPFEEVYIVAVVIPKYLNFDVARLFNILLDEDAVVFE